jgi:DNA-3-methyladenine glycosylase II
MPPSKLPSPEAHLSRVCPGLRRFVRKHEPFPTAPRDDVSPYQSLFRAIVYQQLSGKAAATILGRTIALFPETAFPAPEAILRADVEYLRSAGLSRQKIAAVKDLSEKRLSGLVPDRGEIDHLDDEAIIERLAAVRGVGRWTVQMYLIFTLNRPDVLPIDDLGVRKGAQAVFERDFSPKQLAEFGVRWAPYRSAAAWHLWRVADTLGAK